jgi:Cytochrome P460
MKLASVFLALIAFLGSAIASEKSASNLPAARFSSTELKLPANYRSWVELSPKTPGVPRHQHKHVAGKLFVEPAAFEHFNRTGTWPNKSVIVLELRAEKPSKFANGKTCDVVGLEAAVKDDTHFPDAWSYYGIVYDQPKAVNSKLQSLSSETGEEPLHMMLAMGYPTLRAVINAKPSAMYPTLF